MPPKPFPFPFGVGIDICRTERISEIIEDGDRLNRWARKIFTRLEWPWIHQRVNMAHKGIRKQALSKSTSEAKLLLPNILQDVPLDYKGRADLAFVSSHINNLVQFFAGRWAAKEAAIKAHRHRKLYYRDVSIVPTGMRLEDIRARQPSPAQKPSLLIEPVPQYVVMEAQVAISRGLRDFLSGNSDRYNLLKSIEVISGEVVKGSFVPGTGPGTKSFFLRKRFVEETDRQIAELSISHDGPYVAAVCMALDQETKESGTPVYTFDDGSGNPLHEPVWGDRGWLQEPSLRV